MMKLMGAKRKDSDKLQKSETNRKWWKFPKKTKVKPLRHLEIKHNVTLDQNYEEDAECYEMNKYLDKDNNHYRQRLYDENFIMRPDETLATESTRDSLDSSEISSDAFSRNFTGNNYNVTQHIQNNNNKITIIIKHNEGPVVQPIYMPQVIYIQPVAVSQPNLGSIQNQIYHSNSKVMSEIYNSLDDIDSEEHYQFYDERAVDVPEDVNRNSYLVLNFNDAANRKLKRRICTPTRNLTPADDNDRTVYINQRLNKAIENQRNQKSREISRPVAAKTSVPLRTKQNQRVGEFDSRKKTFASQKKLLNEYYNWNVDFPATTIHQNSILYRDAAQNESFRKKLKIMSEKMMTIGGRGQLGNDFGGSTRELSPRKTKANTLLDSKLTRSEISLKTCVNDEPPSNSKISSSLLNLIAIPFNWRSRQLANKRDNSRDKRKANMLMNLFKKKRVMCNKRIQDSDGGFFERFGSMLHARGENNEEQFLGNAALPLVDQDAASFIKTDIKATEPAVIETRMGGIEEDADVGKDSGNESTEADSDSEDKKESIKEIKNALVGMNIEELYEEVLFEIIHNVGSDESRVDNESLFTFMQEAFKFQADTHDELLEKARIKEAPELRLNIEVIEAKDLNSKDPNGLADPFVTLYIASAPNTRYTSSVKSETLNPKYEEHFSLPISDNPNEETLIIEVWDFDPAETVGEKMNKFFEVKGAKGFRKLMKEIALTASSGKHDNEFVGCAKVPLKTIPCSGLVMWYNLDKKGKTRTQGTIKVRLNFSSEKNDQVASQEHRHLLKILLYHELESSQVAHHWWSGQFSLMADTIIKQHQAQSGLTDVDVAFAQWAVYSEVHQQHPLSFELFEKIISNLVRPIQTHKVSHQEEISIFWESTKRLLPSCFGIIRKLRKKVAGDANSLKNLTKALGIISKVALLEPPESTDLFPEQYYGWLKKNEESSWDIREAINQAVSIGTEEYFDSIVDHDELNSDDNEVRLQQLIKVIQLVRSDLQRAIEHHDKAFQESLNFQYAGMIYKVYDKKVMELVKPAVLDICNTKITRLDLLDSKDMKHNRYEEINMLTTLFELYLLLKRFFVLGSALCPGVTEFQMKNYYEWFTSGVAHWLDISVYKAVTRIQKAIELDSLIAIDATVKYSSSAVDTLAIFYQIRIFWQQLAWPSAEGSFLFVSKIVDDICLCCTSYADMMAERVNKLGMVETVYEKKFQVTPEWCLAINNIDYIRQSIHSFVKELGVDEIIRNMSDFYGPMDAQRCSDTLQNVIENAIDTGKNKIIDLIVDLANKMSPAMRRFLTEGAELFDTDSNAMDRLMMYMEDSLKTLHTELNDDNFMRVLDAIWVEISSILFDLVHSSLEKRRPPQFYSNLRSTLQVMVENFKCQNSDNPIVSSDKETLMKIDRLLELHGCETADLIHQYYKERYTIQKSLEDAPFGLLTVQCFFQKNILEIEILNAKHLVPMDSDGSCDPFVRIHFYPEDKFLNVSQPKTKVHQKTLFPMFDEKFSITLSNEQRKMDDAIILFSVKDKDYFGMSNQYVADAFMMFKDIADITSDTGSIKQMHLTLTRPQNEESLESVKALQNRVGDKLAKEFLKKLRTKISDSKAA